MQDFVHEPQCEMCRSKNVIISFPTRRVITVNQDNVEYIYGGTLLCDCDRCGFEWVMNTSRAQKLLDAEKEKEN